MRNVAQIHLWPETIREQFSPSLILAILMLPVGLLLGVAIGRFNLNYGLAAAGALIIAIIVLFRWDEFMVALIIAVHIIVDWYLALRLVSLLLGLMLLVVCYLGRSADHPWVKPRPIWLWVLFLTLTIYPAINGALDLYDADTYYPSIVFSAFIMFWLGNIVARDISALRRVFQLLSVFAVLIAIHSLIEAITGKFLFESARAEALLNSRSNYQLVQSGLQIVGANVSRASSFFGHPNGTGTFLAISFFFPLVLFMESKHLWAKMFYLLGMLLILLGLMFTYSTAAWVAMLTGILAFVIFVGQIKYSALLLLFTAALAAIMLIVFPSQLALQLSHVTANNESSLHLAGWQTAARVIEAYPLFGLGLGGQAYMLGSIPYMVPAQLVPLLEPDNSYLEWGAMAGIPVMLVFLLLLGYVFWSSWRTWRTTDIRYRPLVGAGIVVLIALSVNSLSVDGWTDPGGIASLGWLIAGLVASPSIGRCLPRQLVRPVAMTAEVVNSRPMRLKWTR